MSEAETQAGAPTARKSKWHVTGHVLSHGVAWAALGVGVLTYIEGRRVSLASGSLEKSEVGFGLGEHPIEGNAFRLVTLIPKRCVAKPILIEMPLSVYNRGSKVANDIKVTMAFPLLDGASPATNADISEMQTANGPPVTSVKREVHDAGTSRYVTYSVSKMFPSMIVGLGEPIQAPMPIQLSLDEIKAGLTGSLKMEYSLEVAVFVQFDQGKMITGQVNVSAMVADTLEEAREKIRAEQAQAADALKALDADMSIWTRIARRFGATRRITTFVATSDEPECSTRQGSFVPGRKIEAVTYDF
ncbi:hypothetical protein [Sphingomonas koreensis]